MKQTEESKRIYKMAKTSFDTVKNEYEKDWLEYERIYESEFTKEFKATAEELDRSNIFIPAAKTTVDIMTAIFADAFFGDGFPIEVGKVGDNDEAKKNALITLGKHYYKMDKPYNELTMAFCSSAKFGLGAVIPTWDSGKKQPKTSLIPCTELGFDSEATLREEIQHVSHRFTQTAKDISEKAKAKFYTMTKRELDELLGNNWEKNPFKRMNVIEIYIANPDGTYKLYTYVKDKLVRTADFRSLPIKHGYLFPKAPAIDATKRAKQIAAIGDSTIRVIKPLIDELNMKRNQINDIREGTIDPYTLVGSMAGISPEDAGKIKGTVMCQDPKHVERHAPVGTFDLERDIAIIQNDIDNATAINGVQRGDTSSSDRRSGDALSMINANSSARLGHMGTTSNDTMFEAWAKDWLRLCYINADDELIESLLEGENVLGAKGTRKELDMDITINFGKTINKEVVTAKLQSLLQMLAPRQEADLSGITKQLIKLILGENTDAESIYGEFPPVGGDETLPGGSGAAADTLAEASGAGSPAEPGLELLAAEQELIASQDLAAKFNNQI